MKDAVEIFAASFYIVIIDKIHLIVTLEKW
jgi:hypothetical protein